MATSNKSIVEAIFGKYQKHETEKNIYIPKNMPGINDSGDMILPNHLVLDNCEITSAGNLDELSAIASHVTELDVSGNSITDWSEITNILRSLGKITFLNLSKNPLNLSKSKPTDEDMHLYENITCLILNKVQLEWETVDTLIKQMPRLMELHLSLNDYSSVNDVSTVMNSLKILYFNGNHISSWQHIGTLGTCFPCLESLVLIDLPFSEIDIEEDFLKTCFPKLQYLNISGCKIRQWRHVDKLNILPALTDIRLKGMPLYLRYKDDDFYRQLCIGFLPKIKVLNGSPIGAEERENAERAFIRYFLDKEKKPERMNELQAKYGMLKPLLHVKLSPEKFVSVVIKRHKDTVWMGKICVEQTFQEFRKFINNNLKIEPEQQNYTLSYNDLCIDQGPQILRASSRMLHSLRINDGDEFIIY